MALSVIMMRVRLRHLRVTAVERLRRIVALVAVMMVGHIRAHISLIVVQVDGFRLLVVTWPVVVVVRRRPSNIRRTTEHIPKRRTLDEYRTNDIVRSVQPAVTYHLHIQCAGTVLRDERSYILEHGVTQTCLNKESMVHSAMRLNHTQVVNPSVAVEIKIVNHIPAGVEQLLKLCHVACFRKSRSYGIEVQIERQVGVKIRNRHRGDCLCLGRRSGHSSRVHCLHRHYHLIRRSNSPYAGPATRQSGNYQQ